MGGGLTDYDDGDGGDYAHNGDGGDSGNNSFVCIVSFQAKPNDDNPQLTDVLTLFLQKG